MAATPRNWDDPNTTSELEAQGATRARDSGVHSKSEERHSTSEPSPQSETTENEIDTEKSFRSSSPSWDPEPGFAHIDGDVSGHGYNETTVDIVAVPCIGASPDDTWARDPLGDDYFQYPPSNELKNYPTAKELPGSSILTPTIDRPLPRATQLWIRQGIRKAASMARVLLYRHRELTEGMTLDQAADDLLEQLCKMRTGLKKSRPIFFICHSIGGLVAKKALVRASKKKELKPLVFDCHGMTFFATPHRGSSYMSMPHLRESIQELLYLQRPLPRSITDELRLNNKSLLELHDQFMDIASELSIRTFYETIDSQLSGLGGSDHDEVHFSAPLTSIKSCLIGTRAEQALSLESDHAHCASFGPQNAETMNSYLIDLRDAVRKAEALSANFVHTPLRLPSKVKLELIGFYEDPDSETSQDIRLYVSKHFLEEFLDKGPEYCLRERLNTVATKPRRGIRTASRRLTASPSRMPGALGIWDNVQEFGQRILGSVRPNSSPQSQGHVHASSQSPEIVVTSHAARPHITSVATEPVSTTGPRRSRGLTVPSLSTPGFQRPPSRDGSVKSDGDEASQTASEPVGSHISPKTTSRTSHLDSSRTYGSDNGGYNERFSHSYPFHDYPAGFSRPDPTKRKFMWIHLPFNNPRWVKSIFDKLSEVQNRSYAKLLSNDYWASKHVQGRHANLQASYVKPGCAFVPAEASSPRPSSNQSGRSTSPVISPSHFYLYLPYLHYDTYKSIVRRRNIITRRLRHGRARPVPKDVAELDSLESQVIWEYIGHDPPFNARRTLDQYGYPSLRDTYARDDDQMLYKLTKQRVSVPFKRKRDMYYPGVEPSGASSPASRLMSAAENLLKSDSSSQVDETESDLEDDIIDGNVLMVDQLWLWAIDMTTLVTFFPKRESHPTEGPIFQQADLRNSIYNELNGDLTGRCDNALDLAAFIILHSVTVLLDRTSHPDLEIFRIFDEALGILTERMTSSLKRFRMQTYKDKMHDDSDSDSSEDNRSKIIKQRHRRELEKAERENRDNTSAVLELRDMEDELFTLKNLFSEQQDAIKAMKESYEKPELQASTECGRGFLKEALGRLEEYQKQAQGMLERVDSTRKDYEKLQEMIQRQAQVDEVRWSRLQTELASAQNLSVMVFTIFTVIFLPLSFFTSLFGMNTKEWGGEDDNFISLELIGAISLPASAFIIGVALLAAFSNRTQVLFKSCLKLFRSGVDLTKRGMEKIEPQKSKQAKQKRRQVQEKREQRAKWTQDRGYDYWGTVFARRRGEYEIPETNRKRAMRRRLEGHGTWRRQTRE
ncbi:hypothetical protein F5X99DRAFT_217790 [Biscogniauxia marginata]|nr:hypothetical protein F5X99DRAFT_217790 [Biscogniauxia marginata]